jgi:hypothetical protein
VKFPSQESVEVHLLDDYDCHNYNFINMDVQGYELEVLKGGAETLNHVDYVYCEVNRDEVYETMLILKSWMSILLTIIWTELKLFGLVASGEMLFT